MSKQMGFFSSFVAFLENLNFTEILTDQIIFEPLKIGQKIC